MTVDVGPTRGENSTGRERERKKKKKKKPIAGSSSATRWRLFRSFLSFVGGAYAASCSDRCPKGWGSLNFQIPFFAISFHHALPSRLCPAFDRSPLLLQFERPTISRSNCPPIYLRQYIHQIEISRTICSRGGGGRNLESFQVERTGEGGELVYERGLYLVD